MSESDESSDPLDQERIHRAFQPMWKWMRSLQETLPQRVTGKTFWAELVIQNTDSIKITWASQNRALRTYTVSIRRITGFVEPENFQGEDRLIDLTGDGTFTDTDIEQGQIYIYRFIFMGEGVPDHIVEFSVPFVVPLAPGVIESLHRFAETFEEESRLPPAEKARQAFEQFEELEETMEEMERNALSKITAKYNGDELNKKTARLKAFFIQLRQTYRK